MGEIRSAVDIALEKTANIHGDKGSADNRSFKNSGKKAAGDFLGTGDISGLEKVLEEPKTDRRTLIGEGAISILLASLRLPVTETDLSKIKLSGFGLERILPNTGMAALFEQVEQILKQYLAEREHLEKTLEQQFMPRLRAKQAELAKRYGQNIPMELSQDSEYVAALSKNRRALEQKYDTVIDEVRMRVREIAGIEE